jgi:uncharacterized protein
MTDLQTFKPGKHLTALLAAALLIVISPLALSAADDADYKTIEWTDLIPQEDLDALMNPPEYLNDISDGSLEDQINTQLQGAMSADDSR